MNSNRVRRSLYLLAGPFMFFTSSLFAAEALLPYLQQLPAFYAQIEPLLKGEVPKDFEPLEGIDAHSFIEFFNLAYEGNLEAIRAFCVENPHLQNHSDSQGYTFTAMAAAGYIEGNDSWETFAFLLQKEVPLSEEFEEWLEIPLADFEKDARRKQILMALLQKQSFEPNIEEPYFTVLSTPPSVPVIQKKSWWENSSLQVGVLAVATFLVGYGRNANSQQAGAPVSFFAGTSAHEKK